MRAGNTGAFNWRRVFFRFLNCAFGTLVLTIVSPISSSLAQAPPLGTTADFAILAGTGITNTGASVITGIPAHPGDIGSSSATITGFPPGIVTPPGVIHAINDGPTIAAKNSLATAYNDLAARAAFANLTGQNLGGLTLVPGVYSFNSSAQLTGTLNLNGLGNPNSVFIFNIGSTLTTASASAVSLINGAQGGNVFWRVGSSATLGSTTSFTGDILALTSITLNTGASINCGAAWAQNGAVVLDTNAISICALLAGPGGPGGATLFASLLPPSASDNQRAVANALDNFVANGGTLPPAFLNLLNLSPSDLANALTQLSGEIGTSAAPAGIQAMNSFLSLVIDPFSDNTRPIAENSGDPPKIFKAMIGKAVAFGPAPNPRRWGIWAASYGGRSNNTGDAFVGSHERSINSYGYAVGLDYRITPYTIVGFALAGGGTSYGLSNSLGSGHSNMFQAAVYSSTRINAAYVSTAFAYAWHRVSTDRYVTLAGTDHLTADFPANNIGGRIEAGYRFAIPGSLGLRGYGFTPYVAGQVQIFRTPSYSESAASGSSIFALAYDAHTTTTTRTELGARFDWSIPVDYRTTLAVRSRAAWAHDYWSAPTQAAIFLTLPGSTFTVVGATPVSDLLLASTGAELRFRNGFSLAAWFDGEFAERSQKYAGTGRLRYTW